MQALVVDDSKAIRSIVGRSLRQMGFEVLEAGHGQEALERLRDAPATSLVLVDWNMPVMNGLEFIRAVRANDAWRDLPLVMVTTESELVHVEAALSAGANEYVMKPFTVDILRDKLALLGIGTDGAAAQVQS